MGILKPSKPLGCHTERGHCRSHTVWSEVHPYGNPLTVGAQGKPETIEDWAEMEPSCSREGALDYCPHQVP